MNRRKLLQGMVTVPVAGALAGCRREPEPAKASRGTLRVILNGPFGVVLQKDKDYRITAYVPTDPGHEHELRFKGPANIAGKESKTGKSPSYRFTILDEGLEIGQGRPRIDQGFYDFNFRHIGKFELPENPFVVVSLPRPDYITFTPPAELVQFGDRTTLQPLDHIFEYRMSEPDRVRVRGGDNDSQKVEPPVPCSDLLREYEDFAKTPYGLANARESQQQSMQETLRACSSSDLCVLFGVGFNPDTPDSDPVEHGLRFFNKVLLPSFTKVTSDLQRQLMQTRCTSTGGDSRSSALLMPAAYTYPLSRPRLLQVASVLDCHAGGLMGTSP